MKEEAEHLYKKGLEEMDLAPAVAHYCIDPEDPSRFVRDSALSAQVDYTKIFANELKGLNYQERSAYLSRV